MDISSQQRNLQFLCKNNEYGVSENTPWEEYQYKSVTGTFL